MGFPDIQSKHKYSLGMGMKPISQQFQNAILTDPKEIVLQESCDKIECNALQELSESMSVEITKIDDDIKCLENRMDTNCSDIVLIQNIRKYGKNKDKNDEIVRKCAMLKEFEKIKCET